MGLKYAAFFILDKNDKTLILRYKYGNNKGLYSGPGGHLETSDKNSKEGAIRELYEETSIDYYKLNIIKEKSWTYNKTTKIFSILVEKIPKIKLSDEHDSYKITEVCNLANYNLTKPYLTSLIKNYSLIK